MRNFTITLFLVLTTLTALAAIDPADGNLIAEPHLADYSEGERTPGLSPITDIEYR
jgi:hypothetical protein